MKTPLFCSKKWLALSFIILMSRVFGLLAGSARGEECVYNAELAISTGQGRLVVIAHDVKSGTSITYNDYVVNLPPGILVKQYRLLEADDAIVILLTRSVARGSNYHSLAILRFSGEDQLSVELGKFKNIFTANSSDGLFFINKIGRETSSGNGVLLLVGRMPLARPGDVHYEWQEWDLKEGKVIKAFVRLDKGPFIEEPIAD